MLISPLCRMQMEDMKQVGCVLDVLVHTVAGEQASWAHTWRVKGDYCAGCMLGSQAVQHSAAASIPKVHREVQSLPGLHADVSSWYTCTLAEYTVLHNLHA